MFENNDTWFDAELHGGVDDEKIDFAAVEAVLLRRVRESESLGILSLLRMDEVPSVEKLEAVERNLFTGITHYHEYVEPVNECLRAENNLDENQWDRLKAKLYERLRPIVRLPLWEQQLMAPCTEPTLGHWEAMETVLFDRINRSDEQLKETWVRYETTEEPVTVSALETAEEHLDRQIDDAAGKPVWEQIVSSEEIVPYVKWERAEADLFSRIAKHRELPAEKQPFRFITKHYVSLIRAAGVAAFAAAAVIAVVSLRGIIPGGEQIPTLVYQLEGNAVESGSAADRIEGSCDMVAGGGATLINAHGSIELHNTARLSIDKCTGNEARYRVDFASARDESTNGKISFLVQPDKKRKTFSVQTPDYRIVVTGTYFRVDADLSGKASTRVMEGHVRISGSPLGDTVLHAGQYLQFDPSVHGYRIFNGGQVLRREELGEVPAVEKLEGLKTVLLRTSVAGAEIRIDGNYCGVTPALLRQSAGWHSVRFTRQGYVTVDTSLFFSGAQASCDLAFTLEELPQLRMDALRVEDEPPENTHKARNSRLGPGKGAGTGRSSSSQAYDEARKAERHSAWRKAAMLYQQVVDDPNVTPLRREDALFSIAKLRAEHSRNTEMAKEAFLTYLALFPAGSFAGESWLRLAELEFRRNPDNAIRYYLKFFEKFPRHPRIAHLQHRVGVIYLQEKQYRKAIDMFEQALSNLKTTDTAEMHSIAENLHRALLAGGEEQRAESVRLRYLASGSR